MTRRILSTFSDVSAEKYIMAVAAWPGGHEMLRPLAIAHFEFTDPDAQKAWLAVERLAHRGDEIHRISIGQESKLPDDWTLRICEDITHVCSFTASDCRDRLKQCYLRRAEDELTKSREAGEIDRATLIDKLSKLETHATGDKPKLTMRSPGEILAMTFSSDDILLENGYLSRGDALVIAGQGGIGKSRIVMQLAICCVTGLPFFGWKTHATGSKWLILQTENSNRRLQADFRAMLSEMPGLGIKAVNEGIRIHTLEADEDSFVTLSDPGAVQRIEDAIKEFNPDVVVFDVLRDFATGDLNSDSDMAATCAAIGRITRKGNPKRIPLVIHHALTGKSGAARATGFDRSGFGRNSKVLQGWARAQINIAPHSGEDNEVLIVTSGKANNVQEFQPKAVRLNQDILMYAPDDSIDLDEWRNAVGADAKSKAPSITVAHVVAAIKESGGDGISKADLQKRLQAETAASRAQCYRLIETAETKRAIHRRRTDSLYVIK